MLDQLKTSLEKLYLKNVNFSSGETITSIPQMNKLKSGIFINRFFFHLTLVWYLLSFPCENTAQLLTHKSPLNVRLIK